MVQPVQLHNDHSEARRAMGRALQRAMGAGVESLSGGVVLYSKLLDFDEADFTASDGSVVYVREGVFTQFLADSAGEFFTDSAGLDFHVRGVVEQHILFRESAGKDFTDSAGNTFQSRNA